MPRPRHRRQHRAPFAGGDGLPHADQSSSSTEAKVALLRALFRGRQDVYAKKWKSTKTGKTGWSPADQHPWDTGRPDVDRVFYPLTDNVVYRHVAPPRPGADDTHIGLYPVLADDTCLLLAADFDGNKNGRDWRADTAAYGPGRGHQQHLAAGHPDGGARRVGGRVEAAAQR